ncbi:MAG: TRAP transporter small permease [Betaproteobacteria bacterium]
MERYLVRLERWLLPLLAALLGFITVGVFIQIMLRYVFSTSFLWGEELSLFAFIWCIYLGAAICVRRRSHFAFDFLAGLLSGRAAALQRLLVDLVVTGIAAILVVDGWTYAQLSIQRLSPALGVTLLVPTVIIPVSGALMILAIVADAVRDFRIIFSGRAP